MFPSLFNPADLILLLPLTSGLCWTAVYVLIIWITHKTKVHAMPLWALVINISWELMYSISGFFYWGTESGATAKMQAIMNLVWFMFDAIILYQYFKYSKKFWSSETKKYFVPWTVLAIITGVAINLAIFFGSSDFTATNGTLVPWYKSAAITSAFLDNVMMSICFVAFAFKSSELMGQSLWIGILKLIGTLTPSIYLGFFDFGIVWMAIIPGILCLIFDLIYCICLVKNQRKYCGKIVNFKRI